MSMYRNSSVAARWDDIDIPLRYMHSHSRGHGNIENMSGMHILVLNHLAKRTHWLSTIIVQKQWHCFMLLNYICMSMKRTMINWLDMIHSWRRHGIGLNIVDWERNMPYADQLIRWDYDIGSIVAQRNFLWWWLGWKTIQWGCNELHKMSCNEIEHGCLVDVCWQWAVCSLTSTIRRQGWMILLTTRWRAIKWRPPLTLERVREGETIISQHRHSLQVR